VPQVSSAIIRLFGFSDDATVGGSGYDDLVAGAIPDATTFWPTTSTNVDKGIEQINRNAEMRGRRSATPQLPFRNNPSMTEEVPAYRSVFEKAVRKCFGAADIRSGTPPAAITHTLRPITGGAGSSVLPTVHAQVVRDTLNHKMSGSVFNRISTSFPLDGEGTMEVELQGLYFKNDVAAAPTAVFTGESPDVLRLMDGKVNIDGNATAIPDLTTFEFSYNNNVTKKWYAGRNVVSQTIGTPSQKKRVWWPTEAKFNASEDLGYVVGLGNTSVAQELAQEYSQIQKFEFLVTGGDLSTTPVVAESVKITIFAGVHNPGGGAEAGSAREDITSRFEGGGFYDTVSSKSIEISVINATNTDLT
jgi:hypothetical protein